MKYSRERRVFPERNLNPKGDAPTFAGRAKLSISRPREKACDTEEVGALSMERYLFWQQVRAAPEGCDARELPAAELLRAKLSASPTTVD